MQQRGTRARAQQATPFAETASRAGRNPRPRTTKTARKIISNRVGRPLNVQTTSGRPQSSRFPSQATVGAEPDGNLKYLGWPSLPARSESSSPNRYPSPRSRLRVTCCLSHSPALRSHRIQVLTGVSCRERRVETPQLKLSAHEPRLFRAAKSVPRTPLAMSQAKLQESEEAWLKERVSLRRELDSQRKRAGALEHRQSQLQVC